MEILSYIGTLITGALGAYFLAYYKKKGSNLAETEDKELLTRIETTVKETISHEFSLRLLTYETEKDVLLRSFEISLSHMQKIVSLLEEIGNIYREAKSQNRKASIEENDRIWQLRLSLMSCQIYLPDDVYDAAWDVFVDYTQLPDHIANPSIDWQKYSSEVAAKIHDKTVRFIKLGRSRFRFNRLDELISEINARDSSAN